MYLKRKEVKKMKKECCNIKVSEIDEGVRIEITGKDIGEKAKALMEKCCGKDMPWKDLFKDCCPAR